MRGGLAASYIAADGEVRGKLGVERIHARADRRIEHDRHKHCGENRVVNGLETCTTHSAPVRVMPQQSRRKAGGALTIELGNAFVGDDGFSDFEV
jgi:hypothetical protein